MTDAGDKVRVELADRGYDILFTDLNGEAAAAAFAALPRKRVLIVADGNTARFLPEATAALERGGKQTAHFVFPAGERSKNIDTAMAICARASELGMGRRDTLFAALGGGVVGDLTGFAAAIFMRGVPFIQLPTSLLAMVDSSVGGKTAVDTAFGKNLVGAFHQPQLVVVDCGMLASLPERELGCGLAEIVKTAMIKDAALAERLLHADAAAIRRDPAQLKFAIRRSCEIKAAVVAADERESGDAGRIFLNYGHTFGHALEHLSRFQLSHGEAVAVGMDMAAFAAVKMGLCASEVLEYQHRMLEHFGIAPEQLADRPLDRRTDRIVALMKGDKKNGDGQFRAVLPLAVGEVRTVPLDPAAAETVLAEYYAFRFGAAPVPAGSRKTVAILGLGLLGTSLALALDRGRYRVGVWNRSPEAGEWALTHQAAEEVYPDPETALAAADLAVLCLPIPVTVDFIRRYWDRLKPGAVLTDIASIKGEVMAAAAAFPKLRFVGSHPMAGTEKSGYRSAVKDLYRNADVFVVPGAHAAPGDVERVEDFWRSLSTHPRRIAAADHDRLVAHTSHMLHIIASALTRSILDREDPREQRRHYFGCATGFRDTSRIASSAPEMWRDICLANTAAILPALDEFSDRLAEMRAALTAGDGAKFEELFRLGRDLRDSWLCYKNVGALPRNLVLCGVKHCGKSSVGAEIAAILDLDLTDTDAEIVGADPEHRSVREIFTAEGETEFRRREAAVLARLAADPVRRVIALGGGALSNPFVSETVRAGLGFLVWLDVDDDVAYERIARAGLPPFLAAAADPRAEFAAMNRGRREVFARFADARVDADAPCRRVALRILSLYKDRFFNR